LSNHYSYFYGSIHRLLETHWSRWAMITRIARKVNHKSAELPSQKICVDVYHIKKQLPVKNIREGLFY